MNKTRTFRVVILDEQPPPCKKKQQTGRNKRKKPMKPKKIQVHRKGILKSCRLLKARLPHMDDPKQLNSVPSNISLLDLFLFHHSAPPVMCVLVVFANQ